MSDDVDDIYRSFEEGSFAFVWKFGRIYQIPRIIAELEPARQKMKRGIGITDHAHARNFLKLYRLPPQIILKLRTEPLLNIEPDTSNPAFKYACDIAHNWVKNLPKADLHSHLGGNMDHKLIFFLSVNTLRHLLDELAEKDRETIKSIIENVCGMVCDEINNLIKNSKGGNNDIYKKLFETFYNECSEEFKKNKNKTGLLSYPCGDSSTSANPSLTEWLLSSFRGDKEREEYINKHKDKPADLFFDFLTWKVNNKESIKLDKDDIITIFIVIAGISEGKTIDDAVEFWKNICQKLIKVQSSTSENELKKIINEKIKKIFKIDLQGNNQDIEALCEEINTQFKSVKELFNKNNNKNKIPSPISLKKLLKAPEHSYSVSQMFRADPFFGALHMQYYENIFACVWYLTEQCAEENIRYLEMRVAPSGYTKRDLTLPSAVQALFDGADMCSLYLYLCENKFIWTNFITSLKRHKTPKERAEEIASAVVFRESEIEILKNLVDVNPSIPYKWQPSKIVGVDLSGYEKGHSPAQFTEDFLPVFKVCSFVTIHAGEEETAQSIWEAIYKLNANRIGHGLTIYQEKSLMNLARDTQICLELCPTSNMITNFSENIKHKYPLFKYMKEGLNVTINTDDRATVDTTLSNEFVKSAELFYCSEDNTDKIPLTKWEVLRLIKAGFDNAFINREKKKKLAQMG